MCMHMQCAYDKCLNAPYSILTFPYSTYVKRRIFSTVFEMLWTLWTLEHSLHYFGWFHSFYCIFRLFSNICCKNRKNECIPLQQIVYQYPWLSLTKCIVSVSCVFYVNGTVSRDGCWFVEGLKLSVHFAIVLCIYVVWA